MRLVGQGVPELRYTYINHINQAKLEASRPGGSSATIYLYKLYKADSLNIHNQCEYLKFCKIELFCNQTKVSRVLLWIGHVLHKVNSSIGVEGLGVRGVTNLIIRSSGKKDGVWTFNLKYLFSDSPSSSGSAIFSGNLFLRLICIQNMSQPNDLIFTLLLLNHKF